MIFNRKHNDRTTEIGQPTGNGYSFVEGCHLITELARNITDGKVDLKDYVFVLH